MIEPPPRETLYYVYGDLGPNSELDSNTDLEAAEVEPSYPDSVKNDSGSCGIKNRLTMGGGKGKGRGRFKGSKLILES